jgi:hypothetical protein
MLSDEFGFSKLQLQISRFWSAQKASACVFKRLESLEARLREQELEIQSLRRANESIEPLRAALGEAVARIAALEKRLKVAPPPPKADDWKQRIASVSSAPLKRRASMVEKSRKYSLKKKRIRTNDLANVSRIVSELPDEVSARFPGAAFVLLWRGSEDGFDAREFHEECDGRANTVTLIEDTRGFVFGGFTPASWETRKWNGRKGGEDNRRKGDESRKSFLFSIRSPCLQRPLIMPLKEERIDSAILCGEDLGPSFEDLVVCNRCDRAAESYSRVGDVYRNGAFGVDGEKLLAGARNFTVAEIEVFEVVG